MKKIYKYIITLSCVILFSLTACGRRAPEHPKEVDAKLYIQESGWSETGSSQQNPVEFYPLKSGDVVYDANRTKVTIKSVDDDEIVLSIDGYMVEPNKDGTINLTADPLKKIEIERGESIELHSQTMDAGFELYITYGK